MAILEILHFPDERLRKTCVPVTQIDADLQRVIDDMFATMYAAPGIGLAAIQVNVHKRFMVIDVSEDKNTPLVFINPVIVSKDGMEEMDEGCLSVPGFYESVQRAERIKVQAQNRHGENFVIDADGLLAVCIQHEIDHLDGKLFVDYISSLKRNRIRKKLEKQKRQGQLDQPSDTKNSNVL
ncbi:MAG: peptide deformylase [Gammaproteobacteria bacterium]|nr:peptide deformylase [Gammaproteobacteria bacterium]